MIEDETRSGWHGGQFAEHSSDGGLLQIHRDSEPREEHRLRRIEPREFERGDNTHFIEIERDTCAHI